jgi:hypothetical protein
LPAEGAAGCPDRTIPMPTPGLRRQPALAGIVGSHSWTQSGFRATYTEMVGVGQFQAGNPLAAVQYEIGNECDLQPTYGRASGRQGSESTHRAKSGCATGVTLTLFLISTLPIQPQNGGKQTLSPHSPTRRRSRIPGGRICSPSQISAPRPCPPVRGWQCRPLRNGRIPSTRGVYKGRNPMAPAIRVSARHRAHNFVRHDATANAPGSGIRAHRQSDCSSASP